jgi:hypothetical protein
MCLTIRERNNEALCALIFGRIFITKEVVMSWRIAMLCVLVLSLPITVLAQVPKGQPFTDLQQQLDQVNSKLNALLGQSCPEGEFVTGFTTTGALICGNVPPPPAPVQTTYTMACERCSDEVGLCGTDPFDELHANYQLEFQPAFVGSIAAVGVEISTAGGTGARLELKDVSTGSVLAVSENVATSSTGWAEFKFSPAFVINGASLNLDFVVEGSGARIYNCANTVQFTPAGMMADGLGLSGHLARSYIKINN